MSNIYERKDLPDNSMFMLKWNFQLSEILPSYPSYNLDFLNHRAEVRTGFLHESSVLSALYLWKQHCDL